MIKAANEFGAEGKIANVEYDAWHCEKGNLFKKLQAASKKRNCKILVAWIPAIRNHYYRCLRTSKRPDGTVDLQLAYEKWLSLLYHVTNKHHWPESPLFERLHGCLHGPLSEHEERKHQFFPKDSPAYRELEAIVTDKKLLGDMSMSANLYSTSHNENFHSLRTGRYLPKKSPKQQ